MWIRVVAMVGLVACSSTEAGTPGDSAPRDGNAPIVDASGVAQDQTAAAPDLVSPKPDLALAAGQCRTQSDCMKLEQCLPPGAPKGCGICLKPPHPCKTDAECANVGPTHACLPFPCACGGESACLPGCAGDGDCAPSERCTAMHHCVPKPCQKDGDCPPNFVCGGGQTCARKACTGDAECAGTCVEGACYAAPGTCTPPVA